MSPLYTSTTIVAEVVSDVRCGSNVGGSAQSLRKTPPRAPTLGAGAALVEGTDAAGGARGTDEAGAEL